MKNVAILIEQFLPSIQTFIYEELTAINKFNMFVLTEERLSEDIYPFENVHICKKIKEYSKIIKKQNIKLIHTKFGQNALRYLELKKLTGVPFIASFHGVDASHQLKSGSMLSMYKKKLFPKVDHIIAVSPTLKDNLVKAGCPKNKITVIWSGVDVEKFYYQSRIIQNNEPVKIVCIARLTEKKGHKYLIESFSNIVKVRPNTELLIIGEGRLKDMLQKRISDLNLQDKAKILDFISFRDVADILYNHHIFCLPSITAANGDQEGIPNVLKEACATGMPVVSTYHAGIPLLIKDGKNGFLVKEKDTAQLTDRLLFLVDHPEIWESMGQWGRNHVEENFERFKQAKKVEKLYSDVLKSTKRKR